MQVLERELWRIAVENLDHAEQHAWAALAGARVNPQGWRRARAILQGSGSQELKRRFLLTCVQRNRTSQLKLKALSEIADLGDADAFDDAIDIVGTWSRDDKRAGTKTLLQALVDKRIGRRDQAQAWVWRLASYTPELHEEYAVQRWPETKRLLGLLVNSSGRAHGRNARRLVHSARKQDRRLAVALLAGAVSHTPEGEEVLRGARMRMARKPSAIARELLRNFPKGGKRRNKRAKKRPKRDGVPANGGATVASEVNEATAETPDDQSSGEARKERKGRRGAGGQEGKRDADGQSENEGSKKVAKPKRRRKRAKKPAKNSEAQLDLASSEADSAAAGNGNDEVAAVVDSVGDA
jgi:ribonuclease E